MIVVDVVLCASCRSLDERPVRRFVLLVDVQLAGSQNVARARRPAGVARLCEPCWIRIVGATKAA